MKKTCIKCSEEKSLTEFRKDSNRSDGRQSQCKICARAYSQAKHRDSYSDKRKVSDTARRANGKALIEDAKKNGCIICKEMELCCLELHHLDPASKDFTIGMNRAMSVKRILAEIEKCVVLCSNCHKKVHAGVIIL